MKLSIFLAVFQLLRGERADVHLAPEVGDVGHYKRDDERYNGHASQGELT